MRACCACSMRSASTARSRRRASVCGMPYRTAWALLDDAERALGDAARDAVARPRRGADAACAPLARGERIRRRRCCARSVRAIESRRRARRAAPTAARAAQGRGQPRHRARAAQGSLAGRARHRARVPRQRGEPAMPIGPVASRSPGFHVATTARGESDPLLAQLDARARCRVSLPDPRAGADRGARQSAAHSRHRRSRREAADDRQPAAGLGHAPAVRPAARARRHRAARSLAGYRTRSSRTPPSRRRSPPGRADAGFGIRAAAAQFGLGFVPIVTEQYLFACARGRRLESRRSSRFASCSRAAQRARSSRRCRGIRSMRRAAATLRRDPLRIARLQRRSMRSRRRPKNG